MCENCESKCDKIKNNPVIDMFDGIPYLFQFGEYFDLLVFQSDNEAIEAASGKSDLYRITNELTGKAIFQGEQTT